LKKPEFAVLRKALPYVFFIALFASCAGSPKAGITGKPDEILLLPSGAGLYLWADVAKARPLIEALSFVDLIGNYKDQILNSTNYAAAALFPGGGQERRFFLAATGAFPKSKANLSLTLGKDW
jgi:hypothetical protein